MNRSLLTLALFALLVPETLAQSCSSPPPLRDLPSRSEPFFMDGPGYDAGEAKAYQFGDVFLDMPDAAVMLWGENGCGLWVRVVQREGNAYGESTYQALPKSVSGKYEVPGAPDGGPLFTIGPRTSSGDYWVTLTLSIPTSPTYEGVEAAGVEEEWQKRHR